MSEALLMSTSDLSEKILRELEVTLGAPQPDVAEVRGEKRQFVSPTGL